MFRGSQHSPHHQQRRHHDDSAPPPEPFDDGGPDDQGPARGRGHRHGGGRGRPGLGGPGFGPGGPGFGPGGPGFGPGGPGFGPEGFGPRGRRRRPKGAVREAVLSLLSDGPANGYSLMRQISERSDGAWAPSPGSVYPTLSQLVDEGLIQATSADRSTDYVLTDAGRQYVSDHAEALAAVWAEGSRGAPSHAALRESVMALMGVTQQFRFATDEQRQRAAAQLDDARRALHRILSE